MSVKKNLVERVKKKKEQERQGPTNGGRKRPVKKKKGILREYAEAICTAVVIYYVLMTFVIQAFRIPTGSMETTLLIGDFLLVNKFIYGAKSPDHIPFTDIEIPFFQLPAFTEPGPGDVVVFKYPLDPTLDYIKRCIAVGGQTVEIRDKDVFVDGTAFLDEIDFEVPGLNKSKNNIAPRSRSYPDIFPDASFGNPDNFGPIRIPKKGDVLDFTRNSIRLCEYVISHDGHEFERRFDGYYVDGFKSDIYTLEQDYFFMMGDNRDNSSDSRFWGFVPRDKIVGEALIIYMSWDENARLVEKIRWSRLLNLIE